MRVCKVPTGKYTQRMCACVKVKLSINKLYNLSFHKRNLCAIVFVPPIRVHIAY